MGRNTALLTLVCCLLAFPIQSCQPAHVSVGAQPTAALPDPHEHVVDVNKIVPELVAEFKMVEVAIDPETQRHNVIKNQAGTRQAFLVDDLLPTGFYRQRLVVEDLRMGKTYEIWGLPPTWRDFSDIVWITEDVLVFDKSAQSHYGIHYAIDVREGRVVLASPFPDRLP